MESQGNLEGSVLSQTLGFFLPPCSGIPTGSQNPGKFQAAELSLPFPIPSNSHPWILEWDVAAGIGFYGILPGNLPQ